MERRPAVIRKSDIAPAFAAAKDAGFDHVRVVVENEIGQRIVITAACGDGADDLEKTPLEKWKAGRAT